MFILLFYSFKKLVLGDITQRATSLSLSTELRFNPLKHCYKWMLMDIPRVTFVHLQMWPKTYNEATLNKKLFNRQYWHILGLKGTTLCLPPSTSIPLYFLLEISFLLPLWSLIPHFCSQDLRKFFFLIFH